MRRSRTTTLLMGALLGLALTVGGVLGACDTETSLGNTPYTPSGDSGTSSNGDSGTSSGNDSGGGSDDSGSTQAKDSGTPSTIPDGAILPQGTQLAKGSSLTVEGVTTDGYAIYEDSAALTLSAVALAGGSSPTTIGTIDAMTVVAVIGPVVFSWSEVGGNGAGTLTIWTKANGAKLLSSSSQTAGDGLQAAAVSADGTTVLFYDDVDPTGNTATLALSGTDGPDGASGKVALAAAVAIGDVGCFPVFQFVGAAVVAVYPSAAEADAGSADAGKSDAGSSDGGSGGSDAGVAVEYTATVNTFTGSGVAYILASSVKDAQCALAVSADNTQFLYSTTSGLYAQAVGSAAVQIDATGVFGQFAATDAGLSVVYTSKSDALKQAAVGPAPAPATLISGAGFTNVLALSGDGEWALANKSYNVGPPPVWDLYLASATTTGSATTLSATPVAQPLAIDPFTADSTHALYAFPAPASAGAGTAASLYASSTSGDAGAANLGAEVQTAFATSGAKVVFNADGAFTGYDLFGVDTSSASSAAAPTTLVSLVDGQFFLNAGKDTIVYTWSYADVAVAGLYAMPAP